MASIVLIEDVFSKCKEVCMIPFYIDIVLFTKEIPRISRIDKRLFRDVWKNCMAVVRSNLSKGKSTLLPNFCQFSYYPKKETRRRRTRDPTSIEERVLTFRLDGEFSRRGRIRSMIDTSSVGRRAGYKKELTPVVEKVNLFKIGRLLGTKTLIVSTILSMLVKKIEHVISVYTKVRLKFPGVGELVSQKQVVNFEFLPRFKKPFKVWKKEKVRIVDRSGEFCLPSIKQGKGKSPGSISPKSRTSRSIKSHGNQFYNGERVKKRVRRKFDVLSSDKLDLKRLFSRKKKCKYEEMGGLGGGVIEGTVRVSEVPLQKCSYPVSVSSLSFVNSAASSTITRLSEFSRASRCPHQMHLQMRGQSKYEMEKRKNKERLLKLKEEKDFIFGLIKDLRNREETRKSHFMKSRARTYLH